MRIVLILLLFIYGCSFKDAPSLTPIDNPETVTVSWTGDREYLIKRTLVRATDGFSSMTPVTLSNPVPGAISIGGSLPLTASTYIESAAATRDGTAYSLAASFREGRLEINGLRSVLADDKDQRLDLILVARDSANGASPWTLRLTLLTLPTVISVESLSPVSFPTVKKFQSPNLRIDLLKVVRIKNDKNYPIDLKVKGKWLKGHIARSYTIHEVHRQACSHLVGQRSSTEVHPTELSLLPIDDGLPQSWITHLFDQDDVFRIPPNKELLLGLYGSGSRLASYIDNGVPSVQPAVNQAVSHCAEPDCLGPPPRFDGLLAGRCFGGGPVHVGVKEGTEGHGVSIIFEENSAQSSLSYFSGEKNESPAARPVDLFPSSLPLF